MEKDIKELAEKMFMPVRKKDIGASVTDREALDYLIDQQMNRFKNEVGAAVTDEEVARLRETLEETQPPYLYNFPETFRGAPDQEVRETRHEIRKEIDKEEEEENYYR